MCRGGEVSWRLSLWFEGGPDRAGYIEFELPVGVLRDGVERARAGCEGYSDPTKFISLRRETDEVGLEKILDEAKERVLDLIWPHRE